MTASDYQLRFLDTSSLRVLASHADAQGWHCRPGADVLDQLDPEGLHVLEPLMEHDHQHSQPDQRHTRCAVLIKQDGSSDP